MPRPVEVTLPSAREIRVARRFAAPRALVWDCHTKPELVRRWALGPDGWSMPVCRIDPRVGGRYRYVWRNDETGQQFGAAGENLEVEAPRLIRHTEVMDGLDGGPMLDEPVIDPAHASVNTLVLEERDGRTFLTLTMLFPSESIRDMVVKTGMTDGMALSYDRLDAIAAGSADR